MFCQRPQVLSVRTWRSLPTSWPERFLGVCVAAARGMLWCSSAACTKLGHRPKPHGAHVGLQHGVHAQGSCFFVISCALGRRSAVTRLDWHFCPNPTMDLHFRRGMGSCIPSVITVAGRKLHAENSLRIFRVSAATGGDPELDACMAAGWRACYASKMQLTTRWLPKGLRWHHWKLLVGPLLTWRSWGWLWSAGMWSKLDSTVHKIVRLMFVPHTREDEPWLQWNRRSLRALVGGPGGRNAHFSPRSP